MRQILLDFLQVTLSLEEEKDGKYYSREMEKDEGFCTNLK